MSQNQSHIDQLIREITDANLTKEWCKKERENIEAKERDAARTLLIKHRDYYRLTGKIFYNQNAQNDAAH